MPGQRHRDRITSVLVLAAGRREGDDRLPESVEFRAMLDLYLSSPRPSVRQGNAILDVVSARLTAPDRVDDAVTALHSPLPGGVYCDEWDEAAWFRAARNLAPDGDGDGMPEHYRDWRVVLATAELVFHTRPAHSDALPPSSTTTTTTATTAIAAAPARVRAVAVEFTRPLRFVVTSPPYCGVPAWGPEAQAVVPELRQVTRDAQLPAPRAGVCCRCRVGRRAPPSNLSLGRRR